MCHDRKKSDQKICTCHDRHHYRRNKSDTMHASEDNKTCSNCQNQTYDHRIHAVTVSWNIIFQSRRHVVRLQPIKSIRKANDQKYRKQNSHPSFSKRLLHIIGRTSPEVFSILCLIYLCQCTFDKCRSTSDHCHQPHPENCSRASCCHRCCNSSNISGSYTRSS